MGIYKDKKGVDNLRLLKARPDEAIEYMHRSKELFHTFLGPFRSMEGQIGNLVDWCTDHDTVKYLQEMWQSQLLEPQPTTPRTHVYPYIAKTPPWPYDDTC